MNKKHYFSLPLLLISILVLTLTACNSNDKWTVEHPDMPDSLRENYLSSIETNLKALNEDETDFAAAFEVGFAYHQLGDYKKAVNYYDRVLEINPKHVVTLNNLATIYEDVEEYDKSADYIYLLYLEQPKSSETIKDLIRIFLKADKPDDALRALEAFSVNLGEDKSEEIQTMISELFVSIKSYKENHE